MNATTPHTHEDSTWHNNCAACTAPYERPRTTWAGQSGLPPHPHFPEGSRAAVPPAPPLKSFADAVHAHQDAEMIAKGLIDDPQAPVQSHNHFGDSLNRDGSCPGCCNIIKQIDETEVDALTAQLERDAAGREIEILPSRLHNDDLPGQGLQSGDFPAPYPYPTDLTAQEREYAGLPPVPGENPSNPKDAVGVKKAYFSTVPGQVVAEIGLGLLEGACKYGRHNYRVVGIRGSVYYDATMRHLVDWWEGQDVDPASGLNHITKALASLVVLRDAMIQEMWTDDRPPMSLNPDWMEEMNAAAAAIIDKYLNPKAPFTREHSTQRAKKAREGGK